MGLFGRKILLCPRCHSDRVYPSSPKPGDFLLRLLLKKPVRCQSCFTRFATWSTPKHPSPPPGAHSPTSGIRPGPQPPDAGPNTGPSPKE